MHTVGSVVAVVPLHGEGILPTGTRADVFREIFWVFLLLGTLVGVVVIVYMFYNAYKYRDGGARAGAVDGRERGAADDRPTLGELPTGGGGGRKLFLSFALSTVIVISLIAWTYGTLLYVEAAPTEQEDDVLEIRVEAYQFGWAFTYPNGHTADGTLRVPQGETVELVVTSRDVFHNFGIPELRVKADAIPGQTTTARFTPSETGTYQANCYELCGAGHSYMTAEVVVMEPDDYERWYENTASNSETPSNATTANSTTANASASVGGDR
ncbi:cytochrome c oxidase subunit II [Halegenticoccus soli]|uniref:cytochrome c oxidase subunit II n=1 Tax=Halegenticoccus soli TaxID=1985678 RepID=UPI000C6EADCF|nr:cytochrome c oxidase subunit II [Halegenticoccus soli]